MLLLTLLQLLAPSFSAFAAGELPNFPPRVIEEVQTEQLVILGQAIESKTTGEQIALACTEQNTVNDTCKKYRFVIIKNSSAFLFGPEMQVANDQELQTSLKETYQNLKKQIKHDRKTDGGAIAGTFLVLGLSIGGTVAALVFAPALITAGSALGVFVFMSGGTMWARNHDFLGGSIGSLSSRTMSVTKAKNGWNWSVQPELVNHKKFYHYKRSIERLDQRVDTWWYRPMQIKMAPAKEGQCKVGYDFTNYGPTDELTDLFSQNSPDPRDRIEVLKLLMLADEMSKSIGCVFAPHDKDAEYKLKIERLNFGGRSNKNRYSIIEKSTNQVIAQKDTRTSGYHDVRNDLQLSESLEE